jgi:hypothetical protein
MVLNTLPKKLGLVAQLYKPYKNIISLVNSLGQLLAGASRSIASK